MSLNKCLAFKCSMYKIYSPQHKNHDRAIQEWQDDLEWLEKESDNILASCNK